jgi:multisubunit Na+/H+ antiporter MnhC subunit
MELKIITNVPRLLERMLRLLVLIALLQKTTCESLRGSRQLNNANINEKEKQEKAARDAAFALANQCGTFVTNITGVPIFMTNVNRTFYTMGVNNTGSFPICSPPISTVNAPVCWFGTVCDGFAQAMVVLAMCIPFMVLYCVCRCCICKREK